MDNIAAGINTPQFMSGTWTIAQANEVKYNTHWIHAILVGGPGLAIFAAAATIAGINRSVIGPVGDFPHAVTHLADVIGCIPWADLRWGVGGIFDPFAAAIGVFFPLFAGVAVGFGVMGATAAGGLDRGCAAGCPDGGPGLGGEGGGEAGEEEQGEPREQPVRGQAHGLSPEFAWFR